LQQFAVVCGYSAVHVLRSCFKSQQHHHLALSSIHQAAPTAFLKSLILVLDNIGMYLSMSCAGVLWM
jgi:hypothetical protein